MFQIVECIFCCDCNVVQGAGVINREYKVAECDGVFLPSCGIERGVRCVDNHEEAGDGGHLEHREYHSK